MCGVVRGMGPGRALVSCSLAGLLLGGTPVPAGGLRTVHPVQVPGPRQELEDRIPCLKAARQRARARLGDPQCLAVLSDFRSVTGLRLDEELAASGRTAQEQFDLLALESGLGRYMCSQRVTMASTRVYSSVVSICLRSFTLLSRAEQDAVLIHEMLHSLGLGENPPESVAITAQVLKRCGH